MLAPAAASERQQRSIDHGNHHAGRRPARPGAADRGRVGAVAAPVLALAVALPAHYPYHFDTLGHLELIYLATLVFVAGALAALPGLLARRGTPSRGAPSRATATRRRGPATGCGRRPGAGRSRRGVVP
jgi:hypothetical protein